MVIIENLLQMAQMNTPETGLHIRDMDVKRHLDKCIQTLHEIARKRNVVIRNTVSESFPRVTVSTGAFAEIVTNLLSNAIRYATHEIVVDAQVMPEKIQFCVHDDGPGIPRDRLPHLFEKFSKGLHPQAGLFQGSGLGLYICKNMVQQLRGQIWAESEDGQGTRFYFTLPKSKPAAPAV